MPTYSPADESDTEHSRPHTRLGTQEIFERIASGYGKKKPWVYLDAIDSILNVRPDIHLVVGDGRSTDSIRTDLQKHHDISCGIYSLALYPEKMSQWLIFNDILNTHAKDDTKYFVYSSSDIIWKTDWVAEAIKEFDKNPKLQILFPCVSSGDANLPCQIAPGPRDIDTMFPPYQKAAKAHVLNAYAIIFRMDFLRTYGGYPTAFRNCFTESFLSYMCEAMGGEMRLLPRGWCYHHNGVDIWAETGKSYYYYNEEKFKFQTIMDEFLMYKAMNMATVDYLKKVLYV